MVVLGALFLRRTKGRAVAVDAEERRLEWRRFLIAASIYASFSLVMVLLNVRFDLALGFPLAILGIFIFWQYVLEGKGDQRPGPRPK